MADTDDVSRSVAKSLGDPLLVDKLAALKPSELTSLLLAVHRKQASKRSWADVRRQFERDLCTHPSTADARALARVERAFHEAAQGFDAVDVATTAPLGLCSLTGIDQNLVLSAVRSLEVVADPTASLALQVARRRRSNSGERVQLAATARVLRLQPIPTGVPHFSRHFRLHCLVSGGRDRAGSSSFVNEAFVAHVVAWTKLVRALGVSEVRVRVSSSDGSAVNAIVDAINAIGVEAVMDHERMQGRAYYGGPMLALDVKAPDGSWFTPADGGAVSWSQHLLADAKERLFTSGFGAEYVVKRLGIQG